METSCMRVQPIEACPLRREPKIAFPVLIDVKDHHTGMAYTTKAMGGLVIEPDVLHRGCPQTPARVTHQRIATLHALLAVSTDHSDVARRNVHTQNAVAVGTDP